MSNHFDFERVNPRRTFICCQPNIRNWLLCKYEHRGGLDFESGGNRDWWLGGAAVLSVQCSGGFSTGYSSFLTCIGAIGELANSELSVLVSC